jgi:hypothetical protein
MEEPYSSSDLQMSCCHDSTPAFDFTEISSDGGFILGSDIFLPHEMFESVESDEIADLWMGLDNPDSPKAMPMLDVSSTVVQEASRDRASEAAVRSVDEINSSPQTRIDTTFSDDADGSISLVSNTLAEISSQRQSSDLPTNPTNPIWFSARFRASATESDRNHQCGESGSLGFRVCPWLA